MAEGYDGEQAAPLDEGMDEFLCEYVDGAMDPVVLEAFEEYLRANPSMAEHVQCLCQAKRFLSQQARCPHATSRLHERLRTAIAQEQLGQSSALLGSRLGSAAWVTSAAGLMMIFGMLFGSAVIRYQAQPGQEVYVERESAPRDAYPIQAVRLPAGARVTRAVAGPAMALPTLQASADWTPVLGADSVSMYFLAP
jgi:anti-sigma factor RsiW